MGNVPSRRLRADRLKVWRKQKMMEIMAIGMGLMMTAVGVAVGGLTLEAALLMMCRALRAPPLAASLEPAAPSI